MKERGKGKGKGKGKREIYLFREKEDRKERRKEKKENERREGIEKLMMRKGDEDYNYMNGERRRVVPEWKKNDNKKEKGNFERRRELGRKGKAEKGKFPSWRCAASQFHSGEREEKRGWRVSRGVLAW